MAPKFDEVNVFKIPHSRMMQLVNSCNKNLTVTDFANNDALFALLSNLHSVFKEFKSHEEIENHFIMAKLKNKLKSLSIHNSAVCNCHKSDEFTPLFELVEMGYLYVTKAKSTSERLSFGIKLRKGLKTFIKRFIPHMQEEEEVFQPLLMEHFSEEELVEMKNNVIKSHMQQRKSPVNPTSSSTAVIELNKKKVIGSDDSCLNANEIFNQIPNEIMIKIFSYMTFTELFACAQACKRWYNLIYDQSNWKTLNLSDWKKYSFNKETTKKEDEEEKKSKKYSRALKDLDYIDESDEEFADESEIQINEIKILQHWIKYLLPKVGNFVQELNLSNCKSLTNNMSRKILQLCPNLRILNISFSSVRDNSFRGVRLVKLEHLNCEGCENISDNAFKYLLSTNLTTQCVNKRRTCENSQESSAEIPAELIDQAKNGGKNEASNCVECVTNHNIEDLNLNRSKKPIKNEENMIVANNNSLRYINLSGCWSITDYGLGYIATKFDLSNLQYLNLSGCINLSTYGMSVFVEMSKLLKGENLYYCDNFDEGPLKESSNGCENLECAKKFCCRSVQ